MDRVYTTHVPSSLGGQTVDVRVDIDVGRSYQTGVVFTHRGSLYEFPLDGISGRGLTRFMRRVIEFYPTGGFGQIGPRGELLLIGQASIILAIARLVRDVIATVDRFLAAYKRSVLDYAVWLLENPGPAGGMYPALVTTMAARLVAHTNFRADDDAWARVGFEREPVRAEDDARARGGVEREPVRAPRSAPRRLQSMGARRF